MLKNIAVEQGVLPQVPETYVLLLMFFTSLPAYDSEYINDSTFTFYTSLLHKRYINI